MPASHIDDLYSSTADDSTPVGKLYKTAGADMAGGSAPVGHSAQASGITNINGAFGGDSAAANQSLAIQQYYRDHPEVTGSQIAKQQQGLAQQANAVYNPDTWYDKLFNDLALAGSIAGVSLAGGAILAPAVAGLAGGGVAGGIAGGAASGALTGAVGSALQGQNIGKGALAGAFGGGIAAGAAPITSSLTGAGMNPALAGALVKGTAGAATGALGAGLSGGNIGQGAELGGVSGALQGGLKGSGVLASNNQLANVLGGIGASTLTGGATGALSGQGAAQGAAGGALKGATGAVAGSILGAGNTIFNSGSTATQTTNPSLTNSGSNMADTYSNYFNDPSNPTDGSLPTVNNSWNVGTIDPGTGYNNNLNVQGGGTTLGGGYSGAPSGGGGSSGNSSLLSSLAGLLGGGSSGGGGNNALLAQLLGLGSSAIGGSLQSSAAKAAAGTFAGQTAYNPYSVSSNSGNTSFNGTNVSSSLSGGQQQTSNALTGLGQQSINSLNQGTAGAANSYFNNLQANQQGANQRFMAGTQDNEFANGVLGSTAGQYQTQAALGALGQQTTQNQITANNFANTQQQNQLANLTASLNGNNQINQGQLAQQQLGGNLGSAASGANLGAYSPSLAANSNNNIGNLLSTLGQTQNSGGSNQNALLQYLMQGH